MSPDRQPRTVLDAKHLAAAGNAVGSASIGDNDTQRPASPSSPAGAPRRSGKPSGLQRSNGVGSRRWLELACRTPSGCAVSPRTSRSTQSPPAICPSTMTSSTADQSVRRETDASGTRLVEMTSGGRLNPPGPWPELKLICGPGARRPSRTGRVDLRPKPQVLAHTRPTAPQELRDGGRRGRSG